MQYMAAVDIRYPIDRSDGKEKKNKSTQSLNLFLVKELELLLWCMLYHPYRRRRVSSPPFR